ncbi:MAG: SPOR domain-containing protein [Alphaproteobacteria bacterium]|nr:SPOR domain-containing protein [Alphaproteobacteria bacterium]
MGRVIVVAALLWLMGIAPAAADDQANALAAFKRGDYGSALKEWRRLAADGDPGSQFNLGLMYTKGLGVPQDYAQALIWYRKAARQGNADAQNNLGYLYASGLGVPRDYAKALVWYRKAAAQGNPYAQINLHILKKNSGKAAPKTAPDTNPKAGARTARLPASRAPAPRPPKSTAYRIQLSAFKNEDRAKSEAAHLGRIYGPVLGDLRITVARAELGKKGVYYRIQAGPLDDRQAANVLCRKLRGLRQPCMVVRAPGK